MLNFCDFIQVFVFTTKHHLNMVSNLLQRKHSRSNLDSENVRHCLQSLKFNLSVFTRFLNYSLRMYCTVDKLSNLVSEMYCNRFLI